MRVYTNTLSSTTIDYVYVHLAFISFSSELWMLWSMRCSVDNVCYDGDAYARVWHQHTKKRERTTEISLVLFTRNDRALARLNKVANESVCLFSYLHTENARATHGTRMGHSYAM